MANGREVNEGRFSLIVQGDGLPVEEIEKGLGLKATRLIRKDEVLNRLPLFVAPQDEWVYAVPLTEPQGADAELNALLNRLQERKNQIAYCLMPETLEKLVAIGLPLNVSSLSWGEVGL